MPEREATKGYGGLLAQVTGGGCQVQLRTGVRVVFKVAGAGPAGVGGEHVLGAVCSVSDRGRGAYCGAGIGLTLRQDRGRCGVCRRDGQRPAGCPPGLVLRCVPSAGCFQVLVCEPVPASGPGPGRGVPMRRWQPCCHNDCGWRAACQRRVSQVPGRGWPGRCAGRLAGWCPGSLDGPADLPAPAAGKAQARGELDLARLTGTDD